MDSNSIFIKLKASRFRDEGKGSESLMETPSLKSPCTLTESKKMDIFQKIANAPPASTLQKIGKFMQTHNGSLNPITYKQSYSFFQKWQAINKNSQIHSSSFVHITDRFRWINYLLFPLLFLHLWFISIFRIFNYETNGWIFVFGLALELVCLGYELLVMGLEVDFAQDIGSQIIGLVGRERLLSLIGNVYSVGYHLVALGNLSSIENATCLYLFPFDLILIFYKYRLMEQIYSIIRIEVIGSKYKLFMNLFDLSSNIFMMIHCFAILLFLCSYYSPDENWHTISPIVTSNDWISDYIQAFYFACTTMLTVGFGDIRPTNLVQVVCILIVQLVGIMNNAYVINEIGANLSQIHEKRNTLEKDIANAQKLIKCNELGNQSRNQMLDHLVHNQLVNEELSIEAEEVLLDKLSEEFKTEIKESTQLKEIRRNLFVLINFTKSFQEEVSKRLVKVIYPPHAVLPNHHGKERLYLITKGAVDIMTERKYGNRVFPEKLVKSIELTQDKGVYRLNAVYGYASLFSGKPTRIKAVAKNFVVCYSLEHHDIFECIQKSTDDFERYFQIKHKLQLMALPEKYEIPTITSHREHFIPNIYLMVKKMKAGKEKGVTVRRRIIRRERHLAKVLEKFEEETLSKSDLVQGSTSSFPSSNFQEESNRKQATIIYPLQSHLSLINSPLINKPRNLQSRDQMNKYYSEFRKMKLQEKQNVELQLSIFSESHKEYKNYYPRSNLYSIITRYNQSKHLTEQIEGGTMTSTRLDILKLKRRNHN